MTARFRAPSHTVRFCYDDANRLIGVIDPERNKTSYEYNLNDNLIAVIEPLGNRSEFQSDQRNRRIEKKSPDLATGPPQIWAWTYDPNGSPRTQTDPVGTVSTHSYDALNRRTATTYVSAPAGSPSARAWVYDPNGNPTRISETRDGQTVAIEFIYDAFNRPTNLLDANNRAWVQTFDAADQRRTLTSEGVPAVSWSYDNAARNTQIIVEGAGTFGLGYDATDRNETISHPNGVQTTHVFDAAGRIEDIHHARNGGTIARFHYGYDANGNRISQIEENGGPAQTNTYAYDFADRLTDITEPNRYTRYVLNGNSNRIETREGPTAAAAIKRYEADFNARNEITQQREYNSAGAVIATTNFEFGANGNIARQTKPGAETQYRYDALDRLIDITPPTGPPASYRYGPSDVRIASATGGQETRFHYDGERLILESNAVGNPQKHYAYTAAGLLNSALLGAQPQHRSAHLDAQTSPVALSSANGNLVARSYFDPYGVETSVLGARDQAISFQGYWSAVGLGSPDVLSAARLYFPSLGAFGERDPVEARLVDPVVFNGYLIGRSNPERWIDPDGRWSQANELSVRHEQQYALSLTGREAEIMNSTAKFRAEQRSRDGVAIAGDALAAWRIGKGIVVGALSLAHVALLGPKVADYDESQEIAQVDGQVRFLASPVATTQENALAILEHADSVESSDPIEARAIRAELAVSVAAAPVSAFAISRMLLHLPRIPSAPALSRAEATPSVSRPTTISEVEPVRIAVPGDANFIGPMQDSWTLVPDGMGAHLFERANVRGRPALSSLDQKDTPRFYPVGTPENAGQAHKRLHQATAAAGIRNRARKGEVSPNPELSDGELIDGYRSAYNRPELKGILGSLRTPKGDKVEAVGVTPSEAFERLMKWLGEQQE